MKTQWVDKLFDVFPKLQIIFVALGALFFLGLGIYKGITTSFGLLAGLFVGIVGALFIIGSYSVMGIWSITIESLTKLLNNYPNFRRNTVFFFVLSVVIITYIVIFYVEIDILFKVALGIFFLVLLPSAAMSLVREDRRRESFKLLGDQITPGLIAQSPQAAIEHAFTIFEDRLRNRLGVSSSVFGEVLINEAFGQGGALSYSEVEGENRGVRNLMAGAYATYRNPRKHRLVKDDKESVLAIIALVELLIHIVDDSSNKASDKKVDS